MLGLVPAELDEHLVGVLTAERPARRVALEPIYPLGEPHRRADRAHAPERRMIVLDDVTLATVCGRRARLLRR